MSVVTRAAAKAAAVVIRDEVSDGANTATRVGGLLVDIADSVGFDAEQATTIRAEAMSDSDVATLSGLATTAGGYLFDTDGENVFLQNQTDPIENGPWTVHSGAWTRPPNYAAGSSAGGKLVHVVQGTYGDQTWACQTDPPNDVVGTDGTTWGRIAGQSLANTLAIGNLTNGEDIILDDSSDPGVPVMTLSAVTGEGQIACVGEFDIEATDQINLSATIVSVDQGDLRILADEETIIGGGTGGAAGLLTLLNVGGGPAGFLFIDGGPGEFGGIYGNDTDGLTVYSAVAGGLTLESPVGPVVVDVGGTVATFDADLATFADGVDVAITTSGGYATTGNLRTGGDFEFVGLDSTAADMPLISWFGPGEGPNTLTLCYGSVPAGTDIYLFDQTSNGTVNIWGAALDVQSATVGVDTAGDFLVGAGDDIIFGADGAFEARGAEYVYIATVAETSGIYIDASGHSYDCPSGQLYQWGINTSPVMRLTATTWGVMAGAASPPTAPNYTVTNPSTNRSIDVSAADLATVRAVLGTVIADLIANGLYQ